MSNVNTNFTDGQDRLDRWKKWYGVCQLTVKGESLSADNNDSEKIFNNFEDFIKKKFNG